MTACILLLAAAAWGQQVAVPQGGSLGPSCNLSDAATLGADKLDGSHASAAAAANTVPVANSSGKLAPGWIPLPGAGSIGGVFMDADCLAGNHVNGIDGATGQLKCSADASGGGAPAGLQEGAVQIKSSSALGAVTGLYWDGTALHVPGPGIFTEVQTTGAAPSTTDYTAGVCNDSNKSASGKVRECWGAGSSGPSVSVNGGAYAKVVMAGDVGASNGVAQLDSAGDLPLSQLPIHTHAMADLTDLGTALAGKVEVGGDLGGTATAPVVQKVNGVHYGAGAGDNSMPYVATASAGVTYIAMPACNATTEKSNFRGGVWVCDTDQSGGVGSVTLAGYTTSASDTISSIGGSSTEATFTSEIAIPTIVANAAYRYSINLMCSTPSASAPTMQPRIYLHSSDSDVMVYESYSGTSLGTSVTNRSLGAVFLLIFNGTGNNTVFTMVPGIGLSGTSNGGFHMNDVQQPAAVTNSAHSQALQTRIAWGSATNTASCTMTSSTLERIN